MSSSVTRLANLLRNVWAYAVICCGHFADGAEKFTPAALEGETKPQWYLRQMLGSANFRAGPVMAFMSGNLCYQIEHHLYPDLPSNRYAEIADRVQAVCDEYDLPYTTGPLARQYLLTLRTIVKLALPDRFLPATSDDAPETASEDRFRGLVKRAGRAGVANPVHVEPDWPPRSETATSGSTDDTPGRAGESLRSAR